MVACCTCATFYTSEQWRRLPYKGEQSDGEEGLLELRGCGRCDSTLAMHLPYSRSRRRRLFWVLAICSAALAGAAFWAVLTAGS